MSTEVENIIIEHLKALRNELKEFRSETKEELQMLNRLDRVDGHVDRIEKRLELTAA